MKSKGKKGFFTVNNMFYAVLGIIVLLLAHMVVTPHQNVLFFDSKELSSFSQDWTLYCSSGVYSVDLPVNGEYDNTDETVRLENLLPKHLETGTVLLMRSSLQAMSVYVDGVEIYSYGKKYSPPMGRSNGSIWNIAYLPSDAAGKPVSIEITSPYNNYRELFNNVYIGTFRGAMGFLFHEYGVSFVLIMIEFVVSLILLILYLVMKLRGMPVLKKMLYVAETGFFSACWLFTECKLTQVFIANMAGFSVASFSFLAIVLIPPMFYVDELEKRFYHKYIARAVALLEINAVVQIILQAFHIADFYEMVVVTHILMGLSVFVAIVTAIHRYITYGGKDMKILIAITGFMGVCAGAEMLFAFLTGYVSGGILETCVLLIFIIAIGEAIDDNVKIEQERRRALSESIAKNSFFTKISEDIRTPMDAIRSMADLMEKSEELSRNNLDAIHTIHSSADNLLEIINELLDYSKLSSNSLKLTEADYEVAGTVGRVKELIGMRAAEKGLIFEMFVSPDLPLKLRGDCDRVVKLITILLNNALRYTSSGRISLKLTGTRVASGYIKLAITVKDTGSGIKDEDREGVFDPFNVGSDAAKNYAVGTGLGLTVAKQLAMLMGGNIEFESEYGVGSTFVATITQEIAGEETFRSCFWELGRKEGLKKVYLAEGEYGFTGYVRAILNEASIPYEMIRRGMLNAFEFGAGAGVLILCASDYKKYVNDVFIKRNAGVEMAVSVGCNEQINILGSSEIFMAPMTVCDVLKILTEDRTARENIFFDASAASVMVVDDNVVNLKVMSAALKRFGIKATLISSGIQAIDAVRTKSFDLIFMDHMMPEMDGIETAAGIRSLGDEYGKEIKIVALTANASLGIDKMFKEKGFDDYMSKPVSIEMLAKMLKKQLPPEKISENT